MDLSRKLLNIFKLSLIVSLLWSGSPLSAGTPASLYPQTMGKLGPGVVEGLAEGFPRRLIVRFDDTATRVDATRQRMERHLLFEDRQIIEWKRDRYRETKDRALSSVFPGNPQVAKDYDYLPMALVEFPNEETLTNFLALEEVGQRFMKTCPSTLLKLRTFLLLNNPSSMRWGTEAKVQLWQSWIQG